MEVDVSRINVNGETWLVIRRFIEQQIEEKRLRLESVCCTEQQTLILRGEIQALRSILELPNAD